MAAPAGEFGDFWRAQYPGLLRCLAARGASSADAEDVAQVAFMAVWCRWPQVANRPGYLYRVAGNELGRLRARCDQQAVYGAGRPLDQLAGDAISARLQGEAVCEQLLALPPRQRTVVAGGVDGYPDAELAILLDMPVTTIRSNRRHAQQRVADLAAALDRDPGGLKLRRAYAEMRSGNLSPAGARRVISASWARSAQLLPAPERGPLVTPLSHSELAARRSLSPLGHAHPVWQRQAGATGLMIVVADADGRVLWRSGERKELRRGEHDGHGEGACLAEYSVGTSGVSVTLAAGHPVAVRGAEHYCPAQHDLVCAGAPVHDPRTGQLLGAVCISAPWPAAHPDMLKTITATARQIQQQIARRAVQPDCGTSRS